MNFVFCLAFSNQSGSGLLGISLALAVFSALLISSSEAIESMTPIHIIANQRQIEDVSAFSSAEVLFINQSHRLACEYPVKYLSGLLQSGVMVALNISIHGSSVIIL
jgi:hypothetical protein